MNEKNIKKLNTPLNEEEIDNLNVGDVVSISGTIYTARDQAHKRIVEDGAPFDIKGASIFHAGPIVKDHGDNNFEMIAVGPTTSMRMNPYEADLLKMGVKAIIGKGGMDDSVLNALKSEKAVYLAATGGCAALFVDAIKDIADVFFLDLGIPEAIWKLDVESFGPLIVAMDSKGESLYK